MKKLLDRKDAYRCKDITALNQILIDIKPKRSLGELYINQKIDVTNLVKYVENLKKENNEITYFHAFSTAIGKLIYNRSLLNRFISNHHVYEHKDITLSYVMKTDFSDEAKEVMIIIPILKNDNIFTISEKIKNKVNNVRNNSYKEKGANKAINILSKMPNIIRIPLISILKFFDKHGILPTSLIKDNIYYSSIIVSNVGSLKCGGIYHNITDFGTCSGIITIGEIKEENKKYYCEFGITIDERIADGFYFIKSIHLLEELLNNPVLLEEPIYEKIERKK